MAGPPARPGGNRRHGRLLPRRADRAIVIGQADFVARAEAICAAEPALHAVQLKDVRGGLDELKLATTEFPQQVRCLDMSANKLTHAELSGLTNVLWTAKIEELNLAFNDLGDAGIPALAAMASPRLKRLSLARNGIGLTGAAALARAVMPQLKSLSLQLNPIGGAGFGSLVTWWRQVVHLEELDLSAVELGSEGATVGSPGMLPALKRLILRGNRIAGPGCGPWRTKAGGI